MSKILIVQYIIQFRRVKSLKEIAADLGLTYAYVRDINHNFENDGTVTVHSKMNRFTKNRLK